MYFLLFDVSIVSLGYKLNYDIFTNVKVIQVQLNFSKLEIFASGKLYPIQKDVN